MDPSFIFFISVLAVLGAIAAAFIVVVRRSATKNKKKRECRQNAAELSQAIDDAGELAAASGCTLEEAQKIIKMAAAIKSCGARLNALSICTQDIKYRDVKGFTVRIARIGGQLAHVTDLFKLGNDGMIVFGSLSLEAVISEIKSCETSLEEILKQESSIQSKLRELQAIRERFEAAAAGLEGIEGIDLSQEKSRVEGLLLRLDTAESSLGKGESVVLPGDAEIDEVMAARDMMVTQRDEARSMLPETRRAANEIITALSKAMDEGAPVEAEKQKLKEIQARINEADRQLAVGNPAEAHRALETAGNALEDIRPAVELKASLLEQYDDGIKSRIAILLESWKHVTPDMLVELPEDCQAWAVVRYYEEQKDSEPIVLRGTTIITPDADESAAAGPADAAPHFDREPAKAEKAGSAVANGGSRICSRCNNPIDLGQNHCGHCGTRVVW